VAGNEKSRMQAAKRIATPTDLSPAESKDVAKAVNALIADSFALYLKTKNFHWHMNGPQFRDFHLLLDEQADQILQTIDVLAERVRKTGGTTLRSIAHISRLQSIKDDDDEFVSAPKMIERLLADNRHMAERQRAAVELTEKRRDFPTSNFLQDMLDQTERRVWFLFEITQAA
jgi:starvation-inducible DNA-binding protein